MRPRSNRAWTVSIVSILLLHAACVLRAAEVRKKAPLTVPVSGMRLDPEKRNQVSGLTLTLEDAGWPAVTMLGHPYAVIGALCKTSDHPDQPWSVEPIRFGSVRMGAGGHVTDQQVTEVANTLTFLNDRDEALKVTVTRLSSAILLEAAGKELELFGEAESSPAPGNSPTPPMCWDEAHQVMAPLSSPPNDRFLPTPFPPPPGCLKPLRWATPGPDGRVITGVLGTQPIVLFPFIDWHKRFSPISSLAPAQSSVPPVAGLGQGWLLLWYGSESPFLSSKLPAVFTGNKHFHVSAPWRLQTAFQADVPFLLVFENSPRSIGFRQEGKAHRLVVTFPDQAGKVVMLPLFGHDVQSAVTTEQWLQSFPADIQARCDDWARRLANFPVNVKEETVYDAQPDRVTCRETFEYATVRPGAERTVLLRPMLAIGIQQKLPAVVTPPPVNLHYATQFGPLLAVSGNRVEWHLDGLGKYVLGHAVIGPATARSRVLEKDLATEVDKVLAAGHLAPWVVSRQAPWCPGFGTSYGKDPSEVLGCLSELLPLLPEAQQERVREYLTREAAAYSPDQVLQVKIDDGSRREFFLVPKDLLRSYDRTLANPQDDESYEKAPSLFRADGVSRFYRCTNRKPPQAVVEFWRRAMQASLEERDWATLGWFWGRDAVKRCDEISRATDYRRDYWQYTPRAIHRDAAGLIGYLRLCQLSGDRDEPEAWGQLAHVMAFRFALVRYGRYLLDSGLFRMPANPSAVDYLSLSGDFSKPENHCEQVWEVNQHEVTMYSGAGKIENGFYSNSFMASCDNGNGNIQVVFADLTPEVGRMLADWGLKDDVARCVAQYAEIQPIWYKAYSDSEHLSGSELGLTLASDSYQYFTARAWIAGTPPEELERCVDEPWATRGDFFYLRKLADTIEAYRGVKWEVEQN